MTENRTYTEAYLKAIRKDWEQERTQSDIANAVAVIQGQLLTLPQTMEAVARRVVAEVIADQHKLNAEQRAQRIEQRSEHSWGRAPAVIQALQLVAWIAVAVGAFLAGRGRIP